MKLKKYFPICFVEENILLLYKYGAFYLFNINDKTFVKKQKVINSFSETIISRIDLLYRSFRLGVRTGVYVGNNLSLIVIHKTIYEFNTKTMEISQGFSNGVSRPLSFCVSNGVKGFNDGVYWGDYVYPDPKGEKYIYYRTGCDTWKIVYTFPSGEIGHIHKIIPDKYNDCFWIFSGDFENATAIWKATDNFTHVIPILRGTQLFRSCVAFPTNKGIIYATDAPFADNYICLLYKDCCNTWQVSKIAPISGSCIYGTSINNKFVFQTSVEPDGRDFKNKLSFYFSRERGKGIKDNNVHLYVGNLDEGFKDIYQSRKDSLPYTLFQFGTFQFPSGDNKSNLLPFYSMAVHEHNLETQLLDLTHLK